jgi:hypothetical protein
MLLRPGENSHRKATTALAAVSPGMYPPSRRPLDREVLIIGSNNNSVLSLGYPEYGWSRR